MAKLTLATRTDFIVHECCSCGVMYAMTEAMDKQRLRDKERSFCPNGHGQSYVGKSDEQLAKEADQARREAETRFAAERDQRLAAERELKRLSQRAKGGACPCCNRTFVQLTRHMKSQHPGFTP